MGNAFAAVADDVYAAYYNPSGLVHLRRGELTAYYAKLYAGLTDNSSISRSYIAYAHPLRKKGTIAVSYLQLSLAGLYSEDTIGISYAHSVGDRWNLGTTAKYLKKAFGSDDYTQNAINADTGASLGAPDPVFAQNGTSKSAMAFDLGAQYRLTRIYALGFTIMNINAPNMALADGETDKVNSIYKCGLARRTKTSSVDAEVSMRKFTTDEFRMNIGGERWLQSGLGFRGGLGFGQRQYQLTTMGMSYRFGNLEFGYALIYPLTGVSGTFGTHQISMTFRLGKRD